MTHTPISELEESVEMQAEYEFDYRQAHLNRFAENPPLTVTLAPDVARVFTSAEAVNWALGHIGTRCSPCLHLGRGS